MKNGAMGGGGVDLGNLSRRNFLRGASALMAGVAGAGLLPFSMRGARGQSAAPTFPIAETTYGKIRGINMGGILTFRGVPYGASTAGKNRFMPPQKHEKWSGVHDTIGYGMISPQNPASPLGEYTQMIDWDTHSYSGMGEDCLHLNIWTPGMDDKKRPVFFSMHGGGYTTGSGNASGYVGDPLARFGDAVVVTVNHRLGPLGYLNLAEIGGAKYKYSGVAGMMDIVFALEWVQDNIARFGGDPGRVMTFGQSGGGAKSSTLLGMPSGKGLFHRAAVQSGSSLAAQNPETASRAAEALLRSLNITREKIDDIQTIDWTQILASPAAAGSGPVADGEIILANAWAPTAPAVSANVPVLIGTTLEDGLERTNPSAMTEADLKAWADTNVGSNAAKVLEMYRRYHPNATNRQLQARISTDRRGRRSATTQAERKAALGQAPAYLYIWAWPSPAYDGKFGSVHGMDVGMSFDNARQLISGANSPEGQKMADMFASVWVAFAKTGDPNNKSIPPWPVYNAQTRPTMIFDSESRVENDPWKEIREMWNDLGETPAAAAGTRRGARRGADAQPEATPTPAAEGAARGDGAGRGGRRGRRGARGEAAGTPTPTPSPTPTPR